MRIVFFLSTFNFGGAEKHALLLADYYNNHLNWETEVWGWYDPNGLVLEKCKNLNIKTRIVPEWIYNGLISRKRLEFKYKKLFKNVDLVMSFNNRPNIFCAEFIPTINKTTHIWAQQGIDGYEFPKSNQRKALSNLKCVISNSQNGIDFLQNLNVPINAMHKVVNGIDTNIDLNHIHSENWKSHLELKQNDQFNAIMIGNITKLKDHITLIKAWKIVKEELASKGKKAHLFLAGRKDNMYNESFQLINNLNLNNNITFLGIVKDIYGLVLNMDIAVLSSPNEGMPNAIIESMLLGKPFVGTNIPGIREAVGNENVKYLSSPKDHYDLANKIITFAHDDNLKAKVGKKNREYVLETHPIEKLWNDTHQIVLKTLQTK